MSYDEWYLQALARSETYWLHYTYMVFIRYCVYFPRILESLPPLPCQHSAAIGCTKNYQPIGVTVHTRIALRVLKVSCSDVGEEGVAVNCEKKILNTLHISVGPSDLGALVVFFWRLSGSWLYQHQEQQTMMQSFKERISISFQSIGTAKVRLLLSNLDRVFHIPCPILSYELLQLTRRWFWDILL